MNDPQSAAKASETSAAGAEAANPATSAAPADDAEAGTREASDDDDSGDAPKKRKRKRKRKRKSAGEGGDASTGPVANLGASASTMASLRSGLFSHIDDRQVPCRVDGCDETWTWTAAEQIQAFGQPPPKRMCAKHEARTDELGDREVPCTNPGCEKTWTFTRAAALAQMNKSGSSQPPRRVCDDCSREEKELADKEVSCRIDVCQRTWTWTRDAQQKHRAWLRRQAESPGGSGGHGGRGKKGRRGGRRRAGSIHEPPPRLCDKCHEKLGTLEVAAGPCKVHGCTRTAAVDKEQQLRAWAALHTDDLDAVAPLPRRMCEVCRDFCRAHPDRQVPCGRPSCDKTWTYKTGAQLQAMLAGRFDDPIRLCDECVRGGFAREAKGPDGAELMPCVVPLCEGVWHYKAGTRLAAARLGELPVDRMCDFHRVERGEKPRQIQIDDDASVQPTEAAPVEPSTSEAAGPEPEPEAAADSAASVEAT